MNKYLKDILVLDIETVSVAPNYEELPEDLRSHWDRKAIFLRNSEELSHSELFFDRAGIYAEFGKVIVIGVGIFHEGPEGMALRVKSFANEDEAFLLNEFAKFLTTKFDSDHVRLCAHNGKEFDFPYLSRRMLVHGIRVPEALDQGGKKPWEVNHLDTMELWKFGDRKNFTSLGLLTAILGIPTSKSDMDGSLVNQVYYQDGDLDRIAAYCRDDVVATAQLYLKLINEPLIESSNITIVDPE